ncbi:MAG: carboxypeptidase-like regulatory domain-containing protein [Paludibacteraceae bacterium]|nr:carboxypeptidase-like regulatory domain-containing protein [Paludibacteraceae bacterium]
MSSGQQINILQRSSLTAKRSYRRFIAGLTAILVAVLVSATETIIVGEIVNETTGEAIPNVNIHFRGTKIGTTSDENGSYALRVDMTAKCQLVFSAVGYYPERFDIEPGTMAGLQVAMRERVATLTEVVVAPNENPALELLRQVRAHRPDNDRTLHPELSSALQREQTLYVSHIQKRQLRRALWRSLQSGMIAQDDSTYILPLYRETQTFRFAGTDITPANDRQTQALILSETDYSSLLGGEGNLNFYANSVSLMGHAFLSPLATGGNLYYRYYLSDEVGLTENESERSYSETVLQQSGLVRIHFRTRNPFYATFNGEMVIDTTTFAVRSISAYVPAEVAVNYVNNIHITQTLAPDGSIADEHISALLDFTIKTAKAGTVFPTLLLTTSLKNPTAGPDWVLQRSGLTAKRSYSVSGLTAEGGPSKADSAFTALDSLPLIRTAKWIATIATTGYIPTGTFLDIGHVEEILQVNHHEGVHVGLPFRTNAKMSKIVSLEASVGYGIKDRSPKGMGRISIDLPTPRKHIMQLEYNDHYVWSEVDDFDRLLRENSMGWGNFDFTAYAFEALHRDKYCVNTAMRQRQIQYHWFADWSKNVETHTYIRAGWNSPNPFTLSSVHSFTPYSYQSLSAIVRLSWGERKYDGYFMRRYAYSSKYPVLYAGLETGHWSPTAERSYSETVLQQSGLSAEGGLFAHVRIMLTQHANLGMGGTLTYALQAGAIFGRVPSTLLWQANANQGYAYDPYRFTLLHGNQLLADKYVALHSEWNGMGILFNLIPGIRWLHLRELVEAKIVYGYLSNDFKQDQTTSNHQLYSEIGIGLGNILRVCDLYSVWGFMPNDQMVNDKMVNVMWGLRFRIHLGL